MRQGSVKTMNIWNDLSDRGYYTFVLIWSWHTGRVCVVENSEKDMFFLPICSIPIFALCIDFMSIQIFCVKVMLNDPVFYKGRVADSWENICFLWTTSVIHLGFKPINLNMSLLNMASVHRCVIVPFNAAIHGLICQLFFWLIN